MAARASQVRPAASEHPCLLLPRSAVRPRAAGLYVWARDGHKMPVKMPAGCLLVQAGKQLEYVTGAEGMPDATLLQGRRGPPVNLIPYHSSTASHPGTGGYIEAGFHEVVVDASTTAAIERARAGGRSTWRISSTLFGHFASDVMLEPLGRFGDDPAARARFPPIYTGAQVAAELAVIKLGPGARPGDVAAM